MKKELYLGLDVHKDCIIGAVAISHSLRARVFACAWMVDGLKNCRWRARQLCSDNCAPGGWRIKGVLRRLDV